MTVATLLRRSRARNGKDVQSPRSGRATLRADTTANVAVVFDAKVAVQAELPAKETFVSETNVSTVAATTPQKVKSSSKRVCREHTSGNEDSDELLSQTTKRCKLSDPSEPTAFMRSIEAIVVNLNRRPDRMAGCSERFRLHAPWLRHSRFAASDGRVDRIGLKDVVVSWNTASNVEYQIKRSIRKGWNDLDTYQVRQLSLSPGERGCAMSHIRAWQHCLERCGGANTPLLVLEDDAAPTPEFTPTLRRALEALPSDAHVLYLGYSQAADWRRTVSDDLVEAEYVWTTVGYMVWPAGARLLLSRLPIDGPVDNWMAGQCAVGGLKSYAVRPKVIHQADAWNVNSDVAHSDEHYWGPNSDIHHSDAFYWGSFYPEESSVKEAETGGVDGRNSIWADLDADGSEEAWADSESGAEG